MGCSWVKVCLQLQHPIWALIQVRLPHLGPAPMHLRMQHRMAESLGPEDGPGFRPAHLQPLWPFRE